MGVAEAAALLEVRPERVRALIHDGRLSARQVSGRWLIDPDSLDRRARAVKKAGRPFSPARAWALLALASGRDPHWVSPSARRQLAAVLADRGIGGIHHQLGQRAGLQPWYVHPSMISALLDEERAVLGGARASGVLRSADPPEVYVAPDAVDRLVRRYRPDLEPEDANVVMRIVRGPWPFAPGERKVWPAVAAADLLDHPDDDRSVRAGHELLDDLRA